MNVRVCQSLFLALALTPTIITPAGNPSATSSTTSEQSKDLFLAKAAAAGFATLGIAAHGAKWWWNRTYRLKDVAAVVKKHEGLIEGAKNIIDSRITEEAAECYAIWSERSLEQKILDFRNARIPLTFSQNNTLGVSDRSLGVRQEDVPILVRDLIVDPTSNSLPVFLPDEQQLLIYSQTLATVITNVRQIHLQADMRCSEFIKPFDTDRARVKQRQWLEKGNPFQKWVAFWQW